MMDQDQQHHSTQRSSISIYTVTIVSMSIMMEISSNPSCPGITITMVAICSPNKTTSTTSLLDVADRVVLLRSQCRRMCSYFSSCINEQSNSHQHHAGQHFENCSCNDHGGREWHHRLANNFGCKYCFI